MRGGTAPPSLASRPDRRCVHSTSRDLLGTVSKKPPQACQQSGPWAADACLLGVCVTIFVSRKMLSAGSRKGAACSALRERDRDGDQGHHLRGSHREGPKVRSPSLVPGTLMVHPHLQHLPGSQTALWPHLYPSAPENLFLDNAHSSMAVWEGQGQGHGHCYLRATLLVTSDTAGPPPIANSPPAPLPVPHWDSNRVPCWGLLPSFLSCPCCFTVCGSLAGQPSTSPLPPKSIASAGPQEPPAGLLLSLMHPWQPEGPS